MSTPPPTSGMVSITLNADDIANAITTPILVVPAPGEGRCIIPSWMTVEFIQGPDSIPFTSETSEPWIWFYGVGAPSQANSPFANYLTNYAMTYVLSYIGTSATYSFSTFASGQLYTQAYNNLALYTGMFTDAIAPWQGGDGSFKFTLRYFINPTTPQFSDGFYS